VASRSDDRKAAVVVSAPSEEQEDGEVQMAEPAAKPAPGASVNQSSLLHWHVVQPTQSALEAAAHRVLFKTCGPSHYLLFILGTILNPRNHHVHHTLSNAFSTCTNSQSLSRLSLLKAVVPAPPCL